MKGREIKAIEDAIAELDDVLTDWALNHPELVQYESVFVDSVVKYVCADLLGLEDES